MSDETTDTSTTTGEEGGEHTPNYEEQAKEKGWRPKEEYEGDPETWVAPEEFIKRQPLFDKIKGQNKKLKELEKTVEALAKHYQSNIQLAKEKAIADLNSEKKEAIRLGEVETVADIDKKIEHVSKMEEPVTPKKSLAPEIEEFIDKQSTWFNKDKEMTAFAVAYNESYLANNPGDLKKSLEETLKVVKRAFPDKFENTRRNDPPSVEGGTPVTKHTEKYSMSRLTPEQKIVHKQLVTVHKQMTHDEYFKSLEDAGFLEK